MKFKVNKIAAAVAVSLGTSVAGMNVAQADEVMFPNIGLSPTVTTILSVINDDNSSVPELHYRYHYKSASASLTAACQESDYNQRTSANDVVTFDVSGQYGDAKGVLFEPGAAGTRYNKTFAIFKGAAPTRAFAIIDNNSQSVPGVNVTGEAYIIEFVNGSVWGYQAYNAAEIVGWNGSRVVVGNPYDFSDRVENNGEVLVPFRAGLDPDEFWVPIVIMPWAGNIQTALFVTPIATAAPYQTSNNITAQVGLVVNDPDNPSLDVMYDRDENPFSGAVLATVTCIGRVNVPNLISSATQQFVRDSGGWSNVAVTAGQAVVMKLEYNDVAPADLDGKPTGSGSWNNGFWLRQGIRESVARERVTVGTGSAKLLAVYDVAEDEQLNAPYPLIDTRKTTAALPFPPVYGAPSIPYIGIAALPPASDKQ